ncbi:hydantoinase/oxoprolinase family protein, partial [candidate division CSSED10-310 bacterium]
AARKFAASSGLSLEKALLGIIQVVNFSMLRALNVISSGRGLDPRDFILVAFGGAGPLHAAALAQEIGIKEVIIPVGAGLFSAVGLLTSDIVQDFTLSLPIEARDQLRNEKINAGFDRLVRQAKRMFQDWSYHLETDHFLLNLNMRYRGQNYVIAVPWANNLAAAETYFKESHNQRYGYNLEPHLIQISGLRCRVIIKKPPVSVSSKPEGKVRILPVTLYDRIRGQWVPGPLHIRETLPPGYEIIGPAIIAENTATTYVPAGMTAKIDQWSNIRIKVKQ